MRFDFATIEEKARARFNGGEKKPGAKLFADKNTIILSGHLLPEHGK